ncbi:MAG TPA: HAD-IIIC family phosphatase, partial [Pilimelia sp.]|nr:HAD-IIIC family phosphatase [Pilimelia sp.]
MDAGTAQVTGSRAEVLAGLGGRRTPLTLAQIRSITRHLRSLDEPTPPLRAAVLHTYTTELLLPYWQFESLLQGFDLRLYEAPYGALLQEAEPGSGLAAAEPDLVYAFLRWEDLDPRLSLPLSGLTESEGEDLVASAAAMVGGLLRRLRQACPATLVVTLLPRMWGPELGIYDAMAPGSDSELRRRIKSTIARDIESISSALFFDLDEVASEIGRAHLFDLRLWETSRFPFSVAGAQAVVRHLVAFAVAHRQPKAKVIALDADNTLWGGIVGEDGPDGIALGPDYPGSAYVSFQRRLLELQQRGFVLALCSKNNSQDVAEVLTKHPHQVLREEHFAAVAVNWSPKPDNLRTLAKELNLGLESFVFVDDSPHECLAIRQQLPQVTVVQAPADPLQLPYCLDGVARLEITSRTSEDRDRTRMYSQERARQASAGSYGDIEDYLASLQMIMRVGVDDERHVARIAQLTQKTNQFNLTTRRYSEAQILEFMRDPDCLVAHFSLADIFGDSGLVGLAIVHGATGPVAGWDTLLMSCRVIGRRAEQAFVRHVLRRLEAGGVKRVRASYRPTAKNEMVRDFWPSIGFAAAETAGTDEYWYARDLPAAEPD